MSNKLKELGFGPPDLGLPTGECDNGHPWITNLMFDRYGNRLCRTCKGIQAKRFLNKGKKRHGF